MVLNDVVLSCISHFKMCYKYFIESFRCFIVEIRKYADSMRSHLDSISIPVLKAFDQFYQVLGDFAPFVRYNGIRFHPVTFTKSGNC